MGVERRHEAVDRVLLQLGLLFPGLWAWGNYLLLLQLTDACSCLLPRSHSDDT